VVEVRPYPLGDLDHARAATRTPYGRVAAGWERRRRGGLRLDVTVPAGAHAIVHVPAASRHDVDADRDARYIGMRDGRPAYAIGAGERRFEVER
jgi:alpha-L-rhamnosidase